MKEHLCERCMLTVVSASSPAHAVGHGNGVRRSQVITSKQPKLGLTQELLFSRICESTTGYTFTPCVGSFTSPGIDTRQTVACKVRALWLSLFRSHAIHCLVPYSFPIMRRCCLCLLNLQCWWHIKIMFVPKLAAPKQLDRMKVNLATQVSFSWRLKRIPLKSPFP